eukprot:scaffold2623_cov250-Pinguiococcus_pyrenoidosus.AAC.6
MTPSRACRCVSLPCALLEWASAGRRAPALHCAAPQRGGCSGRSRSPDTSKAACGVGPRSGERGKGEVAFTGEMDVL